MLGTGHPYAELMTGMTIKLGAMMIVAVGSVAAFVKFCSRHTAGLSGLLGNAKARTRAPGREPTGAGQVLGWQDGLERNGAYQLTR